MISVQQFVEKYRGKSIDFDKAYGAQCVDLFNFYNKEVVGAPWIGTPKTGGARDLFEVPAANKDKHYKALGANSQLQIGDVLVFGEPYGRVVENGAVKFYGHVTIYIGNAQIIQQNGRIAQRTTVDPLFKKGMIGVLRPLRFSTQTSPQESPDNAQNKNKHIIKKGDTFWGIEESKGLPHGTLQTLNPGIDPRSLAIGQEIILPSRPSATINTAETYYTIKEGDTFWALENAWQLPHGTLQRLNPTSDPRNLQIGQRIRRS